MRLDLPHYYGGGGGQPDFRNISSLFLQQRLFSTEFAWPPMSVEVLSAYYFFLEGGRGDTLKPLVLATQA